MKARSLKVTPQVASGLTLVSGLIHCAKYSGAMMIRTVKKICIAAIQPVP